MIKSARTDDVPRGVSQDLLRLVRTLRAAPREIQELRRPSDDRDREERLAVLERVAGWLYGSWYTAFEVAPDQSALVGRENLASALRASLSAATRWETGWVAVGSAPSGVCVAARGSRTRELRPGEYANLTRRGLPVAPGDSIAVMELVDWIDPATGFWWAQSPSGAPDNPLVRAYFSVGCGQVGYVLSELTGRLDGLRIPYSLKCPSHHAAYSRIDSLIVYLQASAWPLAEPVVRAVARRASAHLRRATPPLTKRIAPGVAFAEDPATNRSFGESRCAALAPAALALLGNPRLRSADALPALTESLRAAGIDARRPWLNAVSHD